MSSDLQFYEFFAGAGLAREGLKRDWACIWANDNDPRKAFTYGMNFGHGLFPADEYRLGDVAEVKVEDLPPGADMAWASFPCQDLSLAGWQRGVSARRSGTFWAFWGLMRDLFDRSDRPPVIVIENVVGLLYGENFTGLCEALAALGMQFGPMVIDARWFVPQSRPRVFIVAVDAGVDCSRFTAPSPADLPWFPASVRKAKAALPPSLADLWRWWSLPAPTHRPPPLEEVIQDDAPGVAWNTTAETERLLNMMSPLNREKVRRVQASGRRAVGLLYKRTRAGAQRAEVRFDGVAGCLRTPGGGSSRQTVVLVEDGRVRSRLLAPQEAAALMGAPHFKLPENYNDAYRAMGDAVVVPAVAWLADHLLTPLAEVCAGRGGIRGGAATEGDLALTRAGSEDRAAQWRALHR